MQDGTQEGNEAYVISHRGARSRGYKRRARERGRARARERERERERESPCVSLSQRLSSTSPVWQRVSATCLRKALDILFYRYKEMPNCTMGCGCELAWPSEKRLEPCTRANVVVGEVP
jgi:hypothetical protein